MDLSIFVSANKALGRIAYQLLFCCHGKKCHDQKQLRDESVNVGLRFQRDMSPSRQRGKAASRRHGSGLGS